MGGPEHSFGKWSILNFINELYIKFIKAHINE